MPEVHVVARDPDASDDETVGFRLGDVVINSVSGAMFFMQTEGEWIELPIPVAP